MRIVPAVLLLPVVLVGCDRATEKDGAASPPARTAVAIDPNGPADPAYVAGLMRATAFNYATCNRSAALRGIDAPAGDAAATVMVAVDSSGSMAARSPAGGTRMTEAARAVGSFAGRLPPGTRVGLAAFGQAGSNRDADKALSCRAPAAILQPPGTDAAAVGIAAGRLRPVGWTPLAAAIGTAAQHSGPKGVVYIVSDGIETCGGDPIAAARRARAGEVIVNVVGFGIADGAEQTALRAVAAAGGGRYIAAQTGALDAALRSEASRAVAGNSVATGRAMQDELGCYHDHMRSQADTTGRRINADQQAGRISSATAAAAFKSQDARYARASADLSANHTGLAAAREAANARAVGAVTGVR